MRLIILLTRIMGALGLGVVIWSLIDTRRILRTYAVLKKKDRDTLKWIGYYRIGRLPWDII